MACVLSQPMITCNSLCRKRLFTMINDLPTIFEIVTGSAKKQTKEKSSISNHSSNKSKSGSKGVKKSQYLHSPFILFFMVIIALLENIWTLVMHHILQLFHFFEFINVFFLLFSRVVVPHTYNCVSFFDMSFLHDCFLIGTKQRGSESGKYSKQTKDEEEEVPDEEDDEEHGETLCGACGENYASDEFWICCDICEKWFHGKCVKITPARAEHIKQYKCPSCSNKRARP